MGLQDRRRPFTHRSRKRYLIVRKRFCIPHVIGVAPPSTAVKANKFKEIVMKIWNKPQVREQAVGMEVTAYLPADIDLI